MENKLRTFLLLMWKNYTVRKRHWKVSLFVEICITILLFTLTQVIRDFVVESSSDMKISINDTYYPIQTKDEILELIPPNRLIYFAPKNDFTNDLMESCNRSCLMLPEKSKILFSYKNNFLITRILKTRKDYISQSNFNRNRRIFFRGRVVEKLHFENPR